MIHRIKTLLRNEYRKTLVNNGSNKKSSVSHVAGKMLILFFAIMLIFTVLSRAAASITVTQVMVDNPRRNKLTYDFTRIGQIIKAEELCINVAPGYRIDKIYVSPGVPVSKNTLLFRYSEEDIKNKYSILETEIAKLKLQIRREQLSQAANIAETTGGVLLSLKQAKSNLEVANMNLEAAERDYEDSYHKTREELLEDKKKEYALAIKNQETMLRLQEKQLILSLRAVEDAKTALSQARELKEHIKHLIESYQKAVISEDKFSLFHAEEAIFQAYYGGEDAYTEHKDAVLTLALTVEGDNDSLLFLQYIISYYDDLQSTANEELQRAVKSTDPIIHSEDNIRRLTENYNYARQNYIAKQKEYEAEIINLEKVLTASGNELRKLRKQDNKLRDYLLAFQLSVLASNDGADYEFDYKSDSETAWMDLYYFLLGDNSKAIEKDITSKELALTRAKEDYEALKKESEIEKADLSEELKELERVIQRMEDGSFDYQELMVGKKQAVKSAKEAVRVAKQAVETMELQYETAKQNDADRLRLYEKSKQISELNMQGYQIDLEQKEKELEAINQLLECSGEVTSSYEGILLSVGLEEGMTTSGEELIKIGVGDYWFKADFDREKAVNVAVGDDVKVAIAGENEGMEVDIISVTTNGNGVTELKTSLPKGDYYLGQKAELQITGQSEIYDLCIPIQALREDNTGHYVLVTREQEGILGTEMIADRISVEVLDKNNYTVAVDGALSRNSNVITDSSKYIRAGDKVRIK
ncbi:hypothetical protein I5677_01705 [Mobilitalea sibirica]|uniref:HlyD family secretion protein n=1 Tax=Mobilitalea sibirica TaxID=1462919 RepID=A0A8J7KRT2_9FIRM|nr:hypothetical protein [Mobilitalea sibirica]MBH1939606.1 hypothetical protein [Mobilitalea sibirica]